MTRTKLEMFKDAVAWVHEQERAYWAGELDGYCVHGVYVGGCGIDWMCGRCESDYQPSATEWAMEIVREEMRRIELEKDMEFPISKEEAAEILNNNWEHADKEMGNGTWRFAWNDAGQRVKLMFRHNQWYYRSDVRTV